MENIIGNPHKYFGAKITTNTIHISVNVFMQLLKTILLAKDGHTREMTPDRRLLNERIPDRTTLRSNSDHDTKTTI